MDIEEAKEYLRIIIREQNELNDVKSVNYINAIESIKTILQWVEHKEYQVNIYRKECNRLEEELDNSINKDKVKEKINNFKDKTICRIQRLEI